MKNLLVLFTILLVSTAAYNQNKKRCGSDEVFKQLIKEDPAFAKKLNDARRNTSALYYKKESNKRPSSIIIPVVVHVVYYSIEENISDLQVQSQIDVMNEDYTALNKDYNNYDAGYKSVKGDFNIQFCLVQVIHKQTSHKAFPLNDAMKFSKRGGSDVVDPLHKLNIWVCDIGDKYLGYAYIPGTISEERFGVVCHYKAFGRGAQFNLYPDYNLGRTVTHELGHSFGLEHIWGDSNCGNDFVDDTPLQDSPNFGCPGAGHLSTCKGTPLEMWMNFMDYTDDRCMYFFSDGQDTRSKYFMDNDPQLNSIVNAFCPSNNNMEVITTVAKTNSMKIDEKTFTLFPTITSGILHLRYTNFTDAKTEVMIFNESGNLVYKQQLSLMKGKTEYMFNAGKLSNGIYFLHLSNGNKSESGKFIVSH